MEQIRIRIYSGLPHVFQLITGFHMLQSKYDIIFEDCQSKNRFPNMAYIEAEYRGYRLIYDVLDGYQYPNVIESLINECNLYFKRSYSEEQNDLLHVNDTSVIKPLGFNYLVTYFGNPLNYEPKWKSLIKPLFGKTSETYFRNKVFEGNAKTKNIKPRILFLTRLWDECGTQNLHLRIERKEINSMRIEIIRRLRNQYGNQAICGLFDDEISRSLAPDLIVEDQFTDRKAYLKLVHASDICIGTMGLHGSIGWKTGEYVAAAKAIVHEKMLYSVPGCFNDGINYLQFTSANECMERIERLVQDSELRYQMQKNNEEYYRKYLRPDKLIQNTLSIVDAVIENKQLN